MNVQVVFNLSAFNDALYLPSAYLVEVDGQGRLRYMQQRATAATIVPYGIERSPALARLLDTVELLTPKALEIRFKPPKAKSPTPLATLLTDPATKPAVEKFIYERIDGFLQDVIREGFSMTLELERKTPACDLQIQLAGQDLIPHISFSKTDSGVEYRFRLGSEDASWPIQSREVRPLTNTDPAWLLVDYELHRVSGINGNMVKPFRNKDVIQVPPDKAKVYFRQFVAKNAGRTRIEASGFEMHTTRSLLATRLRPTENVLERAWYLQLVFEYQGAQFTNGEKRDRVTSVRFTNEEEIVVEQIARDQKTEQQQIRYLLETGLEPDGKLFKCSTQTDLESLIEWMARHKTVLESAGFVLELPQVEGKSIALVTGSLDVKTSAAVDWFDVRGRVQAGDFSFPFKALWQHLRKRDRYYLLPDGSWFLIPESWFARYSEMAEAAKDGPDDALRLPKALFTVLQSAELDSGVGEYAAIDPDAVDYEPSPDLKATLRPYQMAGVKWLVGHYEAGFGACLADDMGLGKTLQTIAYLLYAKSRRNGHAGAETGGAQLNLFQAHLAEIRPLSALIILPASLVFNWQNELARFAPTLFVNAHTGPRRLQDARALASHDVVLTTYHTARQDLDLLGKIGWHVIVLDESQQIKNRASEVSKMVLSLKADNKVSLSGTPIENSLSDLWTQMEFINPATLGSFPEFRDQFLLPIEKRNDETAKERLFKRVRPFFFRRTKEEVAPDLPELTEQLFYSEMTEPQQKLYERTKSAARNEILALFDDPKTRFQALQALTRLRQLANDPRLVEQEYKGGSGKFDDVMANGTRCVVPGIKCCFSAVSSGICNSLNPNLNKPGIPTPG